MINGANMSSLPLHWRAVKLEDIVYKVEKVDPGMEPDKTFQYIDIASINNKNHKIVSPKVYVGSEAPSRARQLVKSGDILFSTVRTYLKNIAVVDDSLNNQIASTGFCVIRPNRNVDNKFLFYYTLTNSFLNPLNEIQRGTSYPAVRDSDVLSQPIPLPPIAEQHRIVAKIEELFTRLDAGVESLIKAKGQLARYRKLLFYNAFSGKLTEDWRSLNKDIVPLSEDINSNKSGKKTSDFRSNYRLIKLDATTMPILPDKWEWHPISDISQRVTVGFVGPMKSEYQENGIPFLRSQNVRENRFDPEGLKFISRNFHEKIIKSALEPGDLVIVRSGNVGVACTIPETLKEANCSDLVIIKQPFGIVPDFGAYYLNSMAKSRIDSNKVGIALSHFNTQSVANFLIPVPPLPEQQEIVRRIDAFSSTIISIEASIDVALKQVGKLRQAILARAFSGKLVPQDPNDEPAEKLLERIRAERAQKSVGKPAPSGRKRGRQAALGES